MTRARRPPAVIVGGIGSTLTLLRELGRHGVETHVLGGGRPTVAAASRYIYFGTNCLVRTARNDAVARTGRDFLTKIGLRGIAHVEFKWDARDGAFKLIECNHRFVNVQELIRRAGIDVAVLAYEEALGRDVRGPYP